MVATNPNLPPMQNPHRLKKERTSTWNTIQTDEISTPMKILKTTWNWIVFVGIVFTALRVMGVNVLEIHLWQVIAGFILLLVAVNYTKDG